MPCSIRSWLGLECDAVHGRVSALAAIRIMHRILEQPLRNCLSPIVLERIVGKAARWRLMRPFWTKCSLHAHSRPIFVLF